MDEAAFVKSQATEGRSGVHGLGAIALVMVFSEAAIRDDRIMNALEHLVDERYAELAACCRAAGVVMHDDAGVGERMRRLLLASDFAFEALRA
ncbi:MAG TPA: hypothetical protein VIG31_06655, partial [Rhodanobacteraceae bacterium]